jgi:hypothetical protein
MRRGLETPCAEMSGRGESEFWEDLPGKWKTGERTLRRKGCCWTKREKTNQKLMMKENHEVAKKIHEVAKKIHGVAKKIHGVVKKIHGVAKENHKGKRKKEKSREEKKIE